MTRPAYIPPSIETTQLHQFGLALDAQYNFGYRDYDDLHRFSIEQPEQFWHFLIDYHNIIGEFPDSPEGIVRDGDKMLGAQFFADDAAHARVNFAENLLQYSPDEADRPALIFQSGDVQEMLTWQQLSDAVSLLQQALRASGFTQGDVAAGFLPNAPIAIIAMLTVTSLGGVWTSCSPDFGFEGIRDRFGQTRPKILFATDSYHYNGKTHDLSAKLQQIGENIDSIEQMIISPLRTGDTVTLPTANAIALEDFVAPYDVKQLEFTRCDFNAPVFIMYSSGTTGVPKCIIHGIGGVLVNLIKEHRLHCDLRRGDRLFYYTTCGWMMWNWLASGLASGLTLLLYDESPLYPRVTSLFDFVAATRARFMGVSAKYIDVLAKKGVSVTESHDLSALQMIGSTGSVLSPEAFDTIHNHIKRDIYINSLSGGTDIVGCFVMGVPTRTVYRGEIAGAALGMAIEVLDSDGAPLPVGQKGELVCARPFPNMPVGFFNDPQGRKYHKAYFAKIPNKWHHGDFIARTEHGGFMIYGRSDATLNPGGVRIGTAEIYRAVETLPEVTESICVGQDFDGDVRVILFVMLTSGVTLDESLVNHIKQIVKTQCTPRHVPAKIIQVTDIPRTRSGKITELAVRDIINGQQPNNLTALANPKHLQNIKPHVTVNYEPDDC